MQHWDDEEEREKEKERRLQERRERVKEKLAAQKQRQLGSTAGDAVGGSSLADGKGKREAQLGLEAVKQLRAECDGVIAAARNQAEQREDQRRDQWDQQVAWLKEEITREAESSRQHNQAIDLEWEAVHNSITPQPAHEAMLAARKHCEQVLQSKEDLTAGIKAVLRERDEAYVKLLQSQTEETDSFIALMDQEHGKFKLGQEQVLEAVEAAYLQERSEIISANKAELNALLEKRSSLEQNFLEQYLKACEAYEAQLEAMRVVESEEYTTLKRRLEGEVASLEAHLDSMRSVYMLNADKLEYNVRVLSERERENKEALQQQKRKITHQWEVLSKIKKRFAVLDKRFMEENLRLADEYQRVTRAFNVQQSKYRHFKATDLLRLSKIQEMKEEEVEQLAEQLIEANLAIRQQILGLQGPASADMADDNLAIVGHAVSASAETNTDAAPLADNESEVLVLSGEELSQRQLIGAFRPGPEEERREGASTEGRNHFDLGERDLHSGEEAGEGEAMSPLAFLELKESLEGGVLSLLLVNCGPQVDPCKVQQLLEQLPRRAEARWDPACVVRGLGIQHEATRQFVERMLLHSGALTMAEGDTQAAADAVRPKAVREESLAPEGIGSGSADQRAADEAGRGSMVLVRAEQVQQGLQALVGLLQTRSGKQGTQCRRASASSPVASPRAATPGTSSGQLAAPPTSITYWGSRVDVMLPLETFQTWTILEPQLSRLHKLLKSRSKVADEVTALKRENEMLKGRLKDSLTSPINDELHLPTRLLLQ
ncbi:hypothetical protein N2152v2_010169 [Parachlorella kessleri]